MRAPIASQAGAGDSALQTVVVIFLVLALGAIVFLRLNRRIRRQTAYMFAAVATLDERRLRDEGYFRPEPIRRMWQSHLRGSFDEQYRLWGVLMFQSWLESNAASGAERPRLIA